MNSQEVLALVQEHPRNDPHTAVRRFAPATARVEGGDGHVLQLRAPREHGAGRRAWGARRRARGATEATCTQGRAPSLQSFTLQGPPPRPKGTWTTRAETRRRRGRGNPLGEGGPPAGGMHEKLAARSRLARRAADDFGGAWGAPEPPARGRHL